MSIVKLHFKHIINFFRQNLKPIFLSVNIIAGSLRHALSGWVAALLWFHRRDIISFLVSICITIISRNVTSVWQDRLNTLVSLRRRVGPTGIHPLNQSCEKSSEIWRDSGHPFLWNFITFVRTCVRCFGLLDDRCERDIESQRDDFWS